MHHNHKTNKTLWITLVAVCVLAGAYALENENRFVSKILTNFNPDHSVTDNYCETNIIPETVMFFASSNSFILTSGLEEGYDGWAIFTKPALWKDGVELKGIDTVLAGGIYTYSTGECHSGTNTGENINTIYCNNYEYYKSTQGIDASGKILASETIHYLINFTVNKAPYKIEKIIQPSMMPNQYKEMGEYKYYNVTGYTCTRIK